MLCLCGGNCGVGYWSVLLSQVAHLYQYCSPDHLHGLADVILQALACHAPDTTAGGQGVELGGVVREFLLSECFPEMRTLHEMLISQYFDGIKSKGCVCVWEVLTQHNLFVCLGSLVP